MPVKKQTVKQTRKPRVARAKPVAPKENKTISFWHAIEIFFRKYFQFSGVATRAEFWWMFLFWIVTGLVFVLILFVVAMIIGSAAGAELLIAQLVTIMFASLYLVMIVPWYALMSRRLHDAGFSAKLLWISVVFSLFAIVVPNARDIMVVDWLGWMWTIVLYILFLLPSKTKDNPYRN